MASSSSPSPPASPLRPLPPPSQSHSPSPSLSPKQEQLVLPAPESKSISPHKKSQPLPWTHQETLALIQAYQEKWYSLKKGQLKAFQWEEVSVTVAAICGFEELSKTATQCRHKIEKLRKRYRSELQKSYPNSWQYFELMDQMERGPVPLNARPISVVKSSNNAISNGNNVTNYNHGYGCLYSGSSDYYNKDSLGSSGGSDDRYEKWNTSHGVEAAPTNKLKSINNIVREDVKGGNRSAKRMAIERGFGSSGSRGVRMPRNPKRKQYQDGDDSGDDDDDDDDEEEEEEEEEKNDVEEDDQVQIEEGEEGGVGVELAAEIRGFTESFMGMESKKIEMMRETERYRMEMEKKRMEMIVEAQRKIVDTIGRAFGDNKKAKMAQET